MPIANNHRLWEQLFSKRNFSQNFIVAIVLSRKSYSWSSRKTKIGTINNIIIVEVVHLCIQNKPRFSPSTIFTFGGRGGASSSCGNVFLKRENKQLKTFSIFRKNIRKPFAVIIPLLTIKQISWHRIGSSFMASGLVAPAVATTRLLLWRIDPFHDVHHTYMRLSCFPFSGIIINTEESTRKGWTRIVWRCVTRHAIGQCLNVVTAANTIVKVTHFRRTCYKQTCAMSTYYYL